MPEDPIKPSEVLLLPSEMDHHDHHYNQIVIGLKGQAEFNIEGLGNLVGPGQGCIVTACSDHAFGAIGCSEILVLNLPDENFLDHACRDRLQSLFSNNSYFQLDNQIQQLISLLVSEMQASPDDHLLSRACNDTLIALLQRHFRPESQSLREKRLNMDIIDHYVTQHIGRKISVAQLAGSVFLGESQFHALFKQQTGVTPHQYVLGKRVDFAKDLLEKGVMTLSQVAEVSGFSTQSAFTHTFSRLYGVSPLQYRKKMTT